MKKTKADKRETAKSLLIKIKYKKRTESNVITKTINCVVVVVVVVVVDLQFNRKPDKRVIFWFRG